MSELDSVQKIEVSPVPSEQEIKNVRHRHLYLIFIIGFFGLCVFWIFGYWQNTLALIDEVNLTTQNSHQDLEQINVREKAPDQIVKGVYLTAYSAGSPKKMDQIIDLLNKTELNGVIIDIKDYSGLILFDSQVPLVKELKTKNNRLGDLQALIKKLHDNNIYVIARQTVFQDPILAQKKPDWAIKSKAGGLWHDNKGLTWVDPTVKGVWKYNVAIAKEAINLGFDEINFDYVRFPSDGNMQNVVYTVGDKERYEIMGQFYHYLNQELKDYPAWLSLDMFGYVMERTDDLRIGQRLVDAVSEVDYISPMMYPSHYSRNSFGHENPAEIPGVIIDNGMKKGAPVFEGKRAKVRPWLQAFDMGAVYSDGYKIREQINMVEKYPNAGWLLWNAANRYTSAGLHE